MIVRLSRICVKKTDETVLSKAEQRRYEDIVNIQTMLAEGYAPVQIKEMLNTTYFRIRRYATGDPFMLCRLHESKEPEASLYKDTIISLLTQNATLKIALEQVTALGFQGKRSAFEAYCRKLIIELGISYAPKRNVFGVMVNTIRSKPARHYVSKTDLIRHLWSGKEIAPADIDYILDKYPKISEIRQCILDFREIYDDKSISLLEQFIEKYSASQLSPLKSFAGGLRQDIDAINNSVPSEMSNGFVEGINNKIKAIKRMMYGRAKIDLLRVRVLFAR